MPEYIYLLHPLRHEFFDNPTSLEEQALDDHFTYLKQATENGRVVLAGPCLDETFGVIVFRAESDEAARQFMLDDPAVSSNVMMAELHPFRISLIERH